VMNLKEDDLVSAIAPVVEDSADTAAAVDEDGIDAAQEGLEGAQPTDTEPTDEVDTGADAHAAPGIDAEPVVEPDPISEGDEPE